MNQKKVSSAHFEEFNIDNLDDWTNGKTNLLIVGDSHSVDIFNALSSVKENQRRYNFHHTGLTEACFSDENLAPTRMQFLLNALLNIKTRQWSSPDCLVRKHNTRDSLFTKQANIIILANHVPDWNMGKLYNYVKFFRSNSNAKIIVFGANYLPYDPSTMLLLKSDKNINSIMYAMDRRETISRNKKIGKVAEKAEVSFFDYYSLLCPDLIKKCIVFNDSRLLYEDNNHWSIDGELHYGKILMDAGILQ